MRGRRQSCHELESRVAQIQPRPGRSPARTSRRMHVTPARLGTWRVVGFAYSERR